MIQSSRLDIHRGAVTESNPDLPYSSPTYYSVSYAASQPPFANIPTVNLAYFLRIEK